MTDRDLTRALAENAGELERRWSKRDTLSDRLDRDTAAHVRDLLDMTFGGYYTGFEAYMTDTASRGDREWRFGGILGFGGKCHLNARRLYVGCYPEDRTAENDALIERVNRRLEEIRG